MKWSRCAVVWVWLASSGLIGAEPSLEPFPIDWNSKPDSPASVSFLLDAPAGRDGFLRASDGHLVLPSGRRFRVWGVNITGTRVSNSDMRWAASRKTLDAWGKPPSRIEPVTGAVVLRSLAEAAQLKAQPLDGAGHALGPARQAVKTAEGWRLTMGAPATTWYVITATR